MPTLTPTLPPVNLASPQFKADPYPFYAQLRAEAPVYRTTLPNKQTAYLVTRYEDVLLLLKDARFAKDPLNAQSAGGPLHRPWVPGPFKALARTMLDVDDPDHARLRALVHKAFTPGLIAARRAPIQALADGLLDAVQPAGGMDLIRDYALPLPVTVIADLLGVPPADRHQFHGWSKKIVSSSTGGDNLRAIPNLLAFLRYLRRLVRLRRAAPGADLISALIGAEDAGNTLSEDELLAMFFLLLIAGHETTVNLIGNGMLALLEHPDQLARLRDEPTLIESAVEELLRYTGPLEMATERYAREDLTLAGVTMPRGTLVLGVIAAANRDERQFPHADTLDLARTPNKHLAFGQGSHYCLGAPLARLEGQIALQTVLRRLPAARLLPPAESLRWRRGLFLRGLEALPLAW
jgi:cytochrome P450